MSDELTHITCEVCGEETPLEDAYASLHETERRIVHTCAEPECLDMAGRVETAAAQRGEEERR